MRLTLSDDLLRLLTASAAGLVAVLSVLLPGSPATLAVALLLVFFLPGYALTRLLFGRELSLDVFLAVSIGLSLLTSMLVALLLALSPLRLTQASALVALLGITWGALLLDRLRHAENARIEVDISWPSRKDLDPVLAVVIAFAVVITGVFAFLILTAEHPSRTNIVLMSVEEDINLPASGTVDEPIPFKLRLTNGEGHQADFAFRVYVNGTEVDAGSTTLDDLESELLTLSVTPLDPGYQQIAVRVYIDGVYYAQLHFWVSVSEHP